MYTGDLVLPGFGESEDDVEADSLQSAADSFGEEGRIDNAVALSAQRFAQRRVGSGDLVAKVCYPEN